jgi:hypothetical protein
MSDVGVWLALRTGIVLTGGILRFLSQRGKPVYATLNTV